MNSTYLGWRALGRRQWPLVVALLALLALELVARPESLPITRLWVLPGILVIGVLAVLSPRRPFDACLSAGVTLAASAALCRMTGTPVVDSLWGLTPTELGGLMALIAILVRQERVWRAVLGVLVIVGGVAAVTAFRPSYFDQFNHAVGHARVDSGEVIDGVVPLLVAIGAGLYFRARDREQARAVAADVAKAQQDERMALARELHDVVAHYVTGIVVHAQGAQAIAQVNPAAAGEVLPVIATSGNEALAAMRRLVGTLRGTEPDRPATTEAQALPDDLPDDLAEDLAEDLRATIERARGAGQPAELTVDLAEPVPRELSRSVLRIVQESLTNAGKHAVGVTRIDVAVAARDGKVDLRITDNGRGQQHNPAGGSGGYGLVGMRERAALLGGSFEAGAAPDGGWQVHVELPIGPRTA